MSRQALSSVLSSQASSSVSRTTCSRFDENLFYFVPLEISLTSWLSTIRCNVKCSAFSSLFGVFRVPDFYVFPAQLWPPTIELAAMQSVNMDQRVWPPDNRHRRSILSLLSLVWCTSARCWVRCITVSCPPIRQYSPGTEVRLQFHLCHVWCCRSLDQLITD